VLRGVAFGNRVWEGERIPRDHHDERDYARVAELGMNAVRFYLNYHTLESDAAPGQWLTDGWQWLDDNIAWAKAHEVYLVLNLHVPQGGYQSLGAGRALWTEPQLQARFVALWRAIAERYADEPTIAGFDLLNEPVVETSIGQWQELAERTIAAIREVDPAHAVFVERVNGVAGDFSENRDRNFFRVSDPNVVYEFHFYKPLTFTHQNAPWVPFIAADARYPDASATEVEWFHLTYLRSAEGARLPGGDSPWHYYAGQPVTVSDPAINVGLPTFGCSNVGAGQALFDELVLERVDAEGKPLEELWRENFDTGRGWFYWGQHGYDLRRAAAGGLVPGQGHSGIALGVAGASIETTVGAEYLRFVPTLGQRYRLSGWMKGERIPPDAACQLSLQFSKSSVPVHTRDRAFIEQELADYLDWGKREQVPVFLGEFGAIRFAFEEQRGGLGYVRDLLDLLLANRVSFTYHCYHESFMGLYAADRGLPDAAQANQPLLELFRNALARPDARLSSGRLAQER
jgi:endoglucanase